MLGLTLLSVLAALSTPATFDKVLLKDGRMIEGTIIESEDEGYTRLEIRGVEIPIPDTLIDSTFVENLENYVPKNKKEEQYLKKGWVLFEGQWMSKGRRDGELKKRAAADKKYIDDVKKRQEWRNKVEEETRHFILVSNLDPDTLQMYAELLEAYYKNFVDFWGISLSPGDHKGKPRIYLYRTPEDFHKITGVSYGVGGFFSPVDMELHLPHRADDVPYGVAVLFHEGNHLLTHLINPSFRYPIWMNEGMAEYYGTAEIDEKGNFIVGRQQDSRIAAMRRLRERGQFFRIRDVMLAEQGTFNANHYAFAWSFIHFLMQSDKYAKTFKGFFGNLSENKDVNVSLHNIYGLDRAAVGMVELPNVAEAFEKRMGKSIEDLEAEWLEWFDQAYGELSPEAYYRAAQVELYYPRDDDEHVKTAVEFYEKAIELGIQDARCYRAYAELLRKGGVIEYGTVATPFQPDQVYAFEMIEKAIELNPIAPTYYCEAAGILLMDGPIQDIERAAALAETAKAIGGSRNGSVNSLYEELMTLIEPARERSRSRAEREAELAAMDKRLWHVAFYFVEGETPPDNLTDLSTADLRELIRAGSVSGKDFVWQAWRDEDPATGELREGTEPWDAGWVAVKECDVFADDLAAADGGASQGG